MSLGLTDLIAGIFKPAVELVDELHTSQEERLTQKARILDIQANVMQNTLEYERDILQAQASIVQAEASSKHWLTAVWRPVTMLTFLVLSVADSTGILPSPLRDEAWSLLQIGLGGYVVGRSAEKVTDTVMKNRKVD